jgi:hypothetical protein
VFLRRNFFVFYATNPSDSSTDWSSSDSDDSDLDDLLNDDDTEMMLLLFGMKQIEDRAKLLDQRIFCFTG